MWWRLLTGQGLHLFATALRQTKRARAVGATAHVEGLVTQACSRVKVWYPRMKACSRGVAVPAHESLLTWRMKVRPRGVPAHERLLMYEGLVTRRTRT
ncbi:hypothetical protein HanIR_Chr11g0517591 [Helianthus annuus]|nr:hypothetical protein HanIR_Chr11g0517591 [Helianthus annuus]